MAEKANADGGDPRGQRLAPRKLAEQEGTAAAEPGEGTAAEQEGSRLRGRAAAVALDRHYVLGRTALYTGAVQGELRVAVGEVWGGLLVLAIRRGPHGGRTAAVLVVRWQDEYRLERVWERRWRVMTTEALFAHIRSRRLRCAVFELWKLWKEITNIKSKSVLCSIYLYIVNILTVKRNAKLIS